MSIEWQIGVQHSTQDFDIYLVQGDSPNGSAEFALSDAAGWESIASNLAPASTYLGGTPSNATDGGAQHAFDWTIPSLDAVEAWVVVVQDNTGQDYKAVSPRFTLVAPSVKGDFNGDGRVDSVDYAVWREGLSSGSFTDADFLEWRNNYGRSSNSTAAQPSTLRTPEPSLIAGALLAMVLVQRRW